MSLRSVPRKREDYFVCYIDNMTDFISMHRPEVDKTKIRKWVSDKVNQRVALLMDNLKRAKMNGEDLTVGREGDEMLWPTVRVVRASDPDNVDDDTHQYGNLIEIPDMDLYKMFMRYRDKIISPSGTVYETVDKCSSYLKGIIATKKKNRKKAKNKMFEAKKNMDKVRETFFNNTQSTLKVSMNSMIGGMGSGFSNLSSVANFNSVTSMCRFLIQNSYGHAERFLESNFYFRNDEQCVTFLVNCKLYGPSDDEIRSVMDKMNFEYPSYEKVSEWILKCVNRYDRVSDHKLVISTLSKMSRERLSFIYYMSNIKHLVFNNESFWRPWMNDLLSDKNVSYSSDVDPSYLTKIDPDLCIVLSTIFNRSLPKNSKGNNVSIYECITIDPELAKKLVCCGKHMEKLIAQIDDVFNLFMNHNVNISFVSELKNQFRDTVVTSDTDSIIYTTKSWLKWYTGDIIMTDEAYNINALVVYWLGKANANTLFHVSDSYGALSDDLYGMNMKNEFMMPVEILTSLKKHYASILKVQEGVFYSEPKLDLKGVGLRGSAYSAAATNYAEWFIRTIINEIYTKAKVNPREKIIHVLRLERLVKDSLERGETEFLPLTAIKEEQEYAEPDVSIYFNYKLWQEVFSDTYGSIQIPTKSYLVPLLGFHSAKYKKWLAEKSPVIYQKLVKFMSKHPNKEINRIPINPSNAIVPEELRPVIDYPNLIYTNARPMYIIMQSLGISVGDAKKNMTFSAMYGWISEEESKKALEHIS